MPDDLQKSNQSLDQAIEALTRAKKAYDLNDRLRCIHNGIVLARETHDLIVGWRTGQAPNPGETEQT